MSAVDEAKAILAAIDGTLLKSGTGLTVDNVGLAIQDGLNHLKSLSKPDIESAALATGLDIAEDFVPQLKLAVDAIKLIQMLPDYKPADWSSPVRIAEDESPYADSEATAAAQNRGS